MAFLGLLPTWPAAGGAGAITPDLIPDEGGDWIAAAEQHDLDRVFLVAPSSSDERIVSTAAASRGFVYAASTMGVTGTRAAVSDTAVTLVDAVPRAGAVDRGVRRAGRVECFDRRPRWPASPTG